MVDFGSVVGVSSHPLQLKEWIERKNESQFMRATPLPGFAGRDTLAPELGAALGTAVPNSYSKRLSFRSATVSSSSFLDMLRFSPRLDSINEMTLPRAEEYIVLRININREFAIPFLDL